MRPTFFKKIFPRFFVVSLLSFLLFAYISNSHFNVQKWIKIVGLSILFSLVITFLLRYLLRQLTLSILRIEDKARAFAEGNFDEKIPVLDEDTYEVRRLVKSLNATSTKLGQLFRKNESKKNEREALFTGMSEGILSVYMDGNILHWNQPICNFFEVPFSRDYKGVPLLEVFRNNQLQTFIKKVKDKKSFVEEEIELPSGKVFHVNGNLLKNPAGEDFGVLMVFNDITRMRQLENHRKEFVANVSHELRTPLTSIQGYVENLTDGSIEMPEIALSFLSTIRRNSERLNLLTEDLLALSELDTQSESIEVKKKDIHEILIAAVKSCEQKAQENQIELKLKSQESCILAVNEVLLEQAIVNLVMNAIRYSSRQGEVIIKMMKKEEHIQISVTDFGVGIAAEHLPRIFERFYSPDKARSRQLGGSGLGLSIVKNIALAHKGNVSVESEEGKGSSFSIILPVH